MTRKNHPTFLLSPACYVSQAGPTTDFLVSDNLLHTDLLAFGFAASRKLVLPIWRTRWAEGHRSLQGVQVFTPNVRLNQQETKDSFLNEPEKKPEITE